MSATHADVEWRLCIEAEVDRLHAATLLRGWLDLDVREAA